MAFSRLPSLIATLAMERASSIATAQISLILISETTHALTLNSQSVTIKNLSKCALHGEAFNNSVQFPFRAFHNEMMCHVSVSRPPFLVHYATEIFFPAFEKRKQKSTKFVWSSLVILSILIVREARVVSTKSAETASYIDNWIWSLALWNGVRAFELQSDRAFVEEMAIGGLISNRNFGSILGSGTVPV